MKHAPLAIVALAALAVGCSDGSLTPVSRDARPQGIRTNRVEGDTVRGVVLPPPPVAPRDAEVVSVEMLDREDMIGEPATVVGTVKKVYAPRLFTIGPEGVSVGDTILVMLREPKVGAPGMDEPWRVGRSVGVTGTVARYTDIAIPEEQLALIPNADRMLLENRPVLIANVVAPR